MVKSFRVKSCYARCKQYYNAFMKKIDRKAYEYFKKSIQIYPTTQMQIGIYLYIILLKAIFKGLGIFDLR